MVNGLNIQNILTLLLLTECSLFTTVGDDCFLKCFNYLLFHHLYMIMWKKSVLNELVVEEILVNSS